MTWRSPLRRFAQQLRLCIEYCESGKLAEAAAAAMIWLLELFEGYFLSLVGDFVLTSSLVLAVAALCYVFCKFGKLAAAAFAAARDANGCLDFIYSELVGVFLLGLLVLLVGVFTVFDGDCAVLAFCSISTSVCLEVDLQRKKKSFMDPFSAHLRSKAVRLILLQTTIRDQVSTASSVACLRVWSRLPDGWTSLTMPSSKRQPHLEVLFVPGQVVWMRLGWPSPGKAKFSFF